jgi:hypothetical protein
VAVTVISLCSRIRVISIGFFPRTDRSAEETSPGAATGLSSTLRITSPALIPAFSAAEPRITDRTKTPSFTPKYPANCPPRASASTPSVALRQDIKVRGISGMGKSGIETRGVEIAMPS